MVLRHGAGPAFRAAILRPAAKNEVFHTNPKRWRGSDLNPSLALRVGAIDGHKPY